MSVNVIFIESALRAVGSGKRLEPGLLYSVAARLVASNEISNVQVQTAVLEVFSDFGYSGRREAKASC